MVPTVQIQPQESQQQLISAEVSGFVASTRGLGAAEAHRAVADLVMLKVQEFTGPEVSADDPLMESGVDSLSATELSSSLQSDLGEAFRVPSTLLFDFPSVNEISVFFCKALVQTETSETSTQLMPALTQNLLQAAPQTVHEVHSSIESMACSAPGGCASADSYWHSLTRARDAVRRIPRQRFDISNKQSVAQSGHFLKSVQLFDYDIFSMGIAEVTYTDPSHRLLLHEVLQACINGGHTRQSMQGDAVGVFVGINVGDWAQVRRDLGGTTSVFSVHGTDSAAAAGRISYLFGLKGPCCTMSTACSSSLVAMAAARQNMQLQTCDSALVAAANLCLHSSGWIAISTLGALAHDGRCKTFDQLADGYGRSEACGAMLLDTNPHKVVVRGVGVNQDGRSASFMAPHGPSQEAVVLTALHMAMLHNSASLSLVEAHGTGTGLGDPIEVGALERVFEQHSQLLTFGSSKSAIGHAETACGVMQLIKAAKMLSWRRVPSNLHLQVTNPKISLASFRVLLVSQSIPLVRVEETNGMRFASIGISSFGASGTNSHVCLGNEMAGIAAEVLALQPLVLFRFSSFAWYDVEAESETEIFTPMLGVAVAQIKKGLVTWEREWPKAIVDYMAEHRVGTLPLVPGTTFMQMACASSNQSNEPSIQLRDTAFTTMLFLDIGGSDPVLHVQLQEGSQTVTVHSSQNSSIGRLHHATMTVVSGAFDRRQVPFEHRHLSDDWLDGRAFYLTLGNDYRGQFRSVESVWFQEAGALVAKQTWSPAEAIQVPLVDACA